ncbi:hypothetical protein IFM89_024443 [Coptis chinensis]|uniref:At1g61320/AtMIF1 LRR domain-containing protein n=1 Tax=Coptis chinensis TaxID=261450 RepID=A0A835HH82_9MAGN|nr:hypothetical protein IFM89_024443 [Coptis chinensis]
MANGMLEKKTEIIIKPRTDKREYRRIVLPNALQVLLISDPETDKAAASMNVSVGYYSDPEGLEGLAHFLAPETSICRGPPPYHKFSTGSDATRFQNRRFFDYRDGISRLPDEIIIMILSLITLREAARTSILFTQMEVSMERFHEFLGPVSILADNDNVMETDYSDQRIRFYLNFDFTREIDRWLQTAIVKRAAKVDVDLSEFSYLRYLYPTLDELYRVPEWVFVQETVPFLKYLSLCYCICDTPRNLSGFKSLKELRLVAVWIFDENIGHILSSCSCLERLSLINCWKLDELKIAGEPLALKHLVIAECFSLGIVEIDAVNLTTFEYYGIPVGFSFQNVPQLVNVVIFTICKNIVAGLTYALGTLSTDIPQMKSLLLHCHIELTFEMPGNKVIKVRKPSGCRPHLCLKELVFSGLAGSEVELEFAKQLVIIAEAIETVKIYYVERTYKYDTGVQARESLSFNQGLIDAATNNAARRRAAESIGMAKLKVLKEKDFKGYGLPLDCWQESEGGVLACTKEMVCWPGCIKSFDNKKKLHRVCYDDGEEEFWDLGRECFVLEVMSHEGFHLSSSEEQCIDKRKPSFKGCKKGRVPDFQLHGDESKSVNFGDGLGGSDPVKDYAELNNKVVLKISKRASKLRAGKSSKDEKAGNLSTNRELDVLLERVEEIANGGCGEKPGVVIGSCNETKCISSEVSKQSKDELQDNIFTGVTKQDNYEAPKEGNQILF